MRTAPGLALFVAAALVAAGPATAQTAVAGLVLDIAAETRDLAFTTKDLVFEVEDLGGGVQSLEGAVSELEVKESETEIRIELAADVLFDFDSADLRAEAEQALRNVADIIRAHEGADVRVEGHTDAKGSDSYNQKLSKRRAESVRDWLMATEGLRDTDFEITGFGESKPAAVNEKPDGSDDPEGRQKNRRVEIVVEKR
jgi:outer membrane protein OmpA-like peptidoglycan-associated protein